MTTLTITINTENIDEGYAIRMEEYLWVSKKMNQLFDEAFNSDKALVKENREVFNDICFLHSQLRRNENFSEDFFGILEDMKGLLGRYMRQIRS